ncbi:MAG: carbamoyl-phosphate synthase large subunit [Deltaproteobacteria bacterium]|nr:MAG: carbamoyl-phosphate synthase large subunit [Deltaproteobacteria bacterium]
MPRRKDLKSILLLGSGPIVIGQACEFDYSGVQALKALREEGYRTILLNSNPATIMTDAEWADRTYIEPITVEAAERIIAVERPDAVLPTMGGQTALNLAVQLAKQGILARYGCQLIGAQLDAIEKAEDRQRFKDCMTAIGIDVPRSGVGHSLDDVMRIGLELGFPLILRPSFTLGGLGGGIAYNREELEELGARALGYSPTHEVLIEESVLGWKEFELEVMRDKADNVVIICSIENVDPMGVHTGDSITVAPAQTLSDVEYQAMRDMARQVIRAIGVETGGSNIQFGVHPDTGRIVVIEMNPRVSRSSALASKATGFPIAKIAAKLAVGYTLDEITNDITKTTPSSFEPAIDYCVVKIPRFNFEKFPHADQTLTTSMKSVGEVMSIGRTFAIALQKALRSMENRTDGLDSPLRRDGARAQYSAEELEQIRKEVKTPTPRRLFWLAEACRAGIAAQELYALSAIDPWFIREVQLLVDAEGQIADSAKGLRAGAHVPDLVRWKRLGFSDKRIGRLTGRTEAEIATQREAMNLHPVFKRVDTCAAEFEANTPYLYSSYEDEDEVRPDDRKKVLILGSGPNRIGQGIEFDYCCVQASFALRAAGYETLMVNCNPETVSTDYDTSDRLYFEPLTLEDVLAVARREKPIGAIVQFGGQTPLKLARGLEKAGIRILGTSVDAIDAAEDRELWSKVVEDLKLRQPDHGIARSPDEALATARRIGYPVMVRPSFVLGGRAMEVVYDDAGLVQYSTEAVQASEERPILIDRFLKDATEVDVDCVGDGKEYVVAGVMEHIEEAGIHSGDSACALPPFSLAKEIVADIARQTLALARHLRVVGCMNVQFAVQGGRIHVLEGNPRASRTVPFVGKATGVPWAKIAALCTVGKSLSEQGIRGTAVPRHLSVKEAVFPFHRFSKADTILGPEMRSTGEVMGVDDSFPRAFAKAQIAAGNALPLGGRVFISVRDEDKAGVVELGARLVKLGFEIVATVGTAEFFRAHGVPCEKVFKVAEGRPHIVDKLIDGEIALVFNTTSGKKAIEDSYSIRRQTLMHGIPYFTALTSCRAAVAAIEALTQGPLTVKSLQEYHSAA